MTHLDVHRNRTNVVSVLLGYNLEAYEFRSEIRKTRSPTSDRIATWSIEKVGGGSTGELRLSLDNGITREIQDTVGFMDILREEGGEPYSILDTPLTVYFLDFPTEPTPDSEP